MAARRLLIVLLVLLGISTLATFTLTPPEDESEETTTETESGAAAPPTPAEQDAGGIRLEAVIDANDEDIEVIGVGEIPLHVGDELVLEVRSRRPDEVEIPAFGQIAAVARDAPATFDLLLEEPGDYEVRLVESERIAGRLEVGPAKK